MRASGRDGRCAPGTPIRYASSLSVVISGGSCSSGRHVTGAEALITDSAAAATDAGRSIGGEVGDSATGFGTSSVSAATCAITGRSAVEVSTGPGPGTAGSGTDAA